MGLNLGSLPVDNFMLGSQQVDRIYKGSDLVWEHSTSPVFETVTIGSQTWTSKSLNLDDGGVGIYSINNDSNNDLLYGKLYSSEAAFRIASKVVGFHIPLTSEVYALRDLLGGTSNLGKLKGYSLWNSPNTGAENLYGFDMVGSGCIRNGNPFEVGQQSQLWYIDSTSIGFPNLTASFSYNAGSVFLGQNRYTDANQLRLIKDE